MDCVEIATNAVLSKLPTSLQHYRPVNREYVSKPYRAACDELRRLLVVVGAYQAEILNAHKGGEVRHDLLCTSSLLVIFSRANDIEL